MHVPRSIVTGSSAIAAVGQTATQAAQPVSQAVSPITGFPRQPVGLGVRGSGMVCSPWARLTAIDLNTVGS